ncbi:MAG: molybdopterin-dependent oxidoreductase, partial [Gammaproteobacteria bacterium]|nr:molybdopterin-dependent oxidoreductase [Gammaproteobacteria bacterium]MYK29440.1 molybdopterin-dependent oxidoreductase [Gammaproteobacteria bacterium]
MVTRRSFAALAALGAGSVLAAPGLPPSPLPTKPLLRALSVLPLNAETPAHLLDEPFTSARRMFVRNNGLLPTSTDPSGWGLNIDGEACLRPRRFSLAELRTQFEAHTYALTIECGGNGRAEFHPPVPGNQWTTG